MKALILGSNSFTGGHFVNYLLENTNLNVIGVSRSTEYKPIFLPYLYKKNKSPRFQFHNLDVNNHTKEILNLIDEIKPEYVINYAAQGEVRNSWNAPEQWFQTNSMGVVKIANHLADKPYLKKYVGISTPEVYGSTEKNLKENHNYFPSTPYAASKLSGDLFLFTLLKKYNFPVVFTRSANVYGIHQQLYRIIPRTIIFLKLGNKIQLHGGGKAVRSFIHIREVADATWKAITKGKDGEVYHIAPEDEEISIKDLVKLICEMMGYNFENSIEYVEENFGQDAMYSLNSDKARNELGWQSSVSLKEGIKEMIQWIDENFDEIKKEPLSYVHKV